MLMTDAIMEGTCHPVFQECHNMMNMGQKFRSRFLVLGQHGNFVVIPLLFQANVTFPAVGVYDAARFDSVFYKRV